MPETQTQPSVRTSTPRPVPRIIFAGGGLGLAALLLGIWAALERLGWQVPTLQPDLLLAHGPLMVCGFLGTLIALERAVAVRQPWAFVAPLLLGGGAMVLGLGAGRLAAVLLLAGSLGFIAIYGVMLARSFTDFTLVMTLGAVALLLGNLFWAFGVMIPIMVYWWAGFLILTIFGERLELSRMRPRRGGQRAGAYLVLGIYVTALGLATQSPRHGMQLAGLGMVGMALWLLLFDSAWHLMRRPGLTRYIGLNLIVGYIWLAVSGYLWLTRAGSLFFGYDAMLHSLFLGFVISMVFAHAPIIFPAISGRVLPWRRGFYLPIGLLQLTLICRIGIDLARHPNAFAWRWAGLLNAVALLGFILYATISAWIGQPQTHTA